MLERTEPRARAAWQGRSSMSDTAISIVPRAVASQDLARSASLNCAPSPNGAAPSPANVSADAAPGAPTSRSRVSGTWRQRPAQRTRAAAVLIRCGLLRRRSTLAQRKAHRCRRIPRLPRPHPSLPRPREQRCQPHQQTHVAGLTRCFAQHQALPVSGGPRGRRTVTLTDLADWVSPGRPPQTW